jgi:photosystem II stability/assembly factor-like uncharacterized protein
VSSIDGVSRLERTAAGRWVVSSRSLRGVHISSLLHDQRSGALFAGAHSGGLVVSFDNGDSWERRMNGLTAAHVFTLASREQDGKTVIYAGTEPAHLFSSGDLGEHWRELPAIRAIPGTERWSFPAPPHIGHVKHVAFHPREARTMYVCVEQGALLRSTDGGATFVERDSFYAPEKHTFYKDCHRLCFCASNPDVMYMTGGDGLFRTDDRGESWVQLTDASSRIGYPDALHLHPGDDDTIFMAGAGSEPGEWPKHGTADGCIMQSRDGGKTWRQLTNGLPQSLHGNIEALSMHVSSGVLEFFSGTTDGQVFASYDGGSRWELIVDGLAPVSKANHHIQMPQSVGTREGR